MKTTSLQKLKVYTLPCANLSEAKKLQNVLKTPLEDPKESNYYLSLLVMLGKRPPEWKQTLTASASSLLRIKNEIQKVLKNTDLSQDQKQNAIQKLLNGKALEIIKKEREKLLKVYEELEQKPKTDFPKKQVEKNSGGKIEVSDPESFLQYQKKLYPLIKEKLTSSILEEKRIDELVKCGLDELATNLPWPELVGNSGNSLLPLENLVLPLDSRIADYIKVEADRIQSILPEQKLKTLIQNPESNSSQQNSEISRLYEFMQLNNKEAFNSQLLQMTRELIQSKNFIPEALLSLSPQMPSTWLAMSSILHDRGLTNPPHMWEVGKDNLSNIYSITEHNRKILAASNQRPNISRFSNEVSLSSIIREINNLFQEDRNKLVLAPSEITSIADQEFYNREQKNIIFVDPHNQQITDEQKRKAAILFREIQALPYFKKESSKFVSFLTQAKKHLKNQNYSDEQIDKFLDIYLQSLEYYGKGLKVEDLNGKEKIIGGYGQISLAAAQIMNLSTESPIAQNLEECINEIVQTTEPEIALANFEPDQLENLRNLFWEKTGTDLLEFEPEAAVFGEDGTEYRPRQPHIRKDSTKLILREILGSFTCPAKQSHQNEKQPKVDENKPNDFGGAFNHFYKKTILPTLHDWVMAHPHLSAEQKRKIAAKNTIDELLKTMKQKSPHVKNDELYSLLAKYLIAPSHLSLAEKTFAEEIIPSIIVQKMGMPKLARFTQEQVQLNEKNYFVGITANTTDEQTLKTKALIEKFLEVSPIQIKIYDGFDVLTQRLERLLDGVLGVKVNNRFWDQSSDNHYRNCQELLNNPSGRLKLLHDIEEQWSNLYQDYEMNTRPASKLISDYSQYAENSELTKKIEALSTTQGSKNFYQIISNLSLQNYQSYEQLLSTLQPKLKAALNDNNQFSNFLKCQIEHIKAISIALKLINKQNIDNYLEPLIKELGAKIENSSTAKTSISSPSQEERIRSFEMMEENAAFLIGQCKKIEKQVLQNLQLKTDSADIVQRAKVLKAILDCWNYYPLNKGTILELREGNNNQAKEEGNFENEMQYCVSTVMQKLRNQVVLRNKKQIQEDFELLSNFPKLAKLRDYIDQILNEPMNEKLRKTLLNNNSFISILMLMQAEFELSGKTITKLKQKSFEEGLMTQSLKLVASSSPSMHQEATKNLEYLEDNYLESLTQAQKFELFRALADVYIKDSHSINKTINYLEKAIKTCPREQDDVLTGMAVQLYILDENKKQMVLEYLLKINSNFIKEQKQTFINQKKNEGNPNKKAIIQKGIDFLDEILTTSSKGFCPKIRKNKK